MLAFLLLCLADTPTQPLLRDRESVEGRSMVVYRTLDWFEKPLVALQGSNDLPPEPRFALLRLGAQGEQRLPVVWSKSSSTLLADLNGDGKIAPTERFTLSGKAVEMPIVIDGRQRTLLARLRQEEPVVAVRGFIESTITLNGQPRKYLLLDRDNDGCFHHAGTDRLGIDLNGDGRIDPLTEHFPVGTAIEIGGVRMFLKPDASGEKLEVHQRPEAIGEIEFTLSRNVPAKPTEIQINLTSEWGEWVPLSDIEKIEKLPAGKYRIERLAFKLAGSKYESWSYSFYSPGSKLIVEVDPKKRTSYELLPDLKLQFNVDDHGKKDGTFITARVTASNGLTMTDCSQAAKASDYHRQSPAEIALKEEGNSQPISKTTCEYRCGSLPLTFLNFPAATQGTPRELSVTLPTGPLAGSLFEMQELKVRKKE